MVTYHRTTHATAGKRHRMHAAHDSKKQLKRINQFSLPQQDGPRIRKVTYTTFQNKEHFYRLFITFVIRLDLRKAQPNDRLVIDSNWLAL